LWSAHSYPHVSLIYEDKDFGKWLTGVCYYFLMTLQNNVVEQCKHSSQNELSTTTPHIYMTIPSLH